MSEGSGSDFDGENESQDGGDVETDEDDGMYFDTNDFLSAEALRSASYRSRESSGIACAYDSGSYFPDHLCEAENQIRMVKYPYVKRRDNLPDPKEKEKPVGLWSIIKDNIGKDLSGVCLPVYFNEPLSSLQKCFEDLEYSYLVDQAFEWGKQVSHSLFFNFLESSFIVQLLLVTADFFLFFFSFFCMSTVYLFVYLLCIVECMVGKR